MTARSPGMMVRMRNSRPADSENGAGGIRRPPGGGVSQEAVEPGTADGPGQPAAAGNSAAKAGGQGTL